MIWALKQIFVFSNCKEIETIVVKFFDIFQKFYLSKIVFYLDL